MGLVAGISDQDLGQARWAVVVSAVDDASLLRAIWPLIAHRLEQMGLTLPEPSWREGERCAEWYARHSDGATKTLAKNWGELPAVLIYRPGETASRFLARHGVSVGPVDPRRGVPYYLLLLGRPGPVAEGDEAYIPPEFQYELGIFWAVGRLCFSDARGAHDLAGYLACAERIVERERGAAPPTTPAAVTCFAPSWQHDAATQTLASELILPLAEQVGATVRRGREAGRGAVQSLLADGRPGFLLLAGHGLGLAFDRPELPERQGAFVTADWPGQGPIAHEHCLSGEDLDGRNLGSLAVLLLASFGAGCPPYDDQIVDLSKGEREGRVALAPFAMIGRLPQALLRAGAAAVIGAYGRFWPAAGASDPAAYADLIRKLREGKPAGAAMDMLALVNASFGITLVEDLEDIRFGKDINRAELARLWMRRANARSLMLLGDPAARLA